MRRYIFPLLICTILIAIPVDSSAGLFGKIFKKSPKETTSAITAHDTLTGISCTEELTLSRLTIHQEKNECRAASSTADMAKELAESKALTASIVPVVVNKDVERFMKHFQTTGRKYFRKWLVRSGKYLPMIQEILNENGLPEDLAYLALIESGFNPHARSHANAVGIWQFMLWTGRYNGLRTDWWIDERKDPEKASHAAARHLRDLYSQFDSWYLAAAGYNAGAGRIRKAIRKNRTEDFWVIAKNRRTLKRETRHYVPKYLAAMIIAKDPEKYGFHNIVPEEPVTYKKVRVDGPTDIKVIAKAAGISTHEIKKLNPELRRWFTPPDYPGYEIKIPEDRYEAYISNMTSLPKQKRVRFHRHKVRNGDTLSTIAESYRTSVKPIMYLNNLKSRSFIRAGSTLFVPVRVGTKTRKARKRFVKATLHIEGTHIVKRGDTLWDLSMKYNIPVKKMMRLNKIRKSDKIRPGQRLYIKEQVLKEAKAENKPKGIN
jgi:membrane-bound lytic murein transglycosylase D